MDKGKRFKRDKPAAAPGHGYWLFGLHAVLAALANPQRRCHRLLHTPEAAALVRSAAAAAGLAVEVVDRPALVRLLPAGAVHQGVALQAEPLATVDIYELCDNLRSAPRAAVVVLDQVTDPHNIGAVLRSAAAFGAGGVVLTERHGAPESGVLAKSASGALEHVPLIYVTNLARAMGELKEAGFWCIGLAADAEQAMGRARLDGRVAIILGSEGGGMRRLTREHCDLLVRLPTRPPIEQLNVSNAAAVALYEWARGGADQLPVQL